MTQATARRALIVLALWSLGLIGCTRAIYNPQVSFPTRDPGAVKQAILQALATRQWLVQDDGPHAVRGTLNLHTNTGFHQVVIRVTYGVDAYAIHYVWSQRMYYGTSLWGTEHIHKNYNEWIRELQQDIDTLLGIARR